MSTTEKSKKLIQDYAQALNTDKSRATLDKFIVDRELREHIILFEAGLPNYQLGIKDLVAEGNKVVCRATVRGQHKGELFGIAPTGQEVNVDGFIMYEIEDNMIVNHWMQFDTMALMQQIGSKPVAAAAH
ncbi:SnoaL-like polyketide cyclase [Neolewinella xylanilytica]|uniref:SnoaL-like polyketide cyclase n=1 Tax=Neolewinella xylanilytica TaxID=1514080 RepID=A0A2S6I1B1_9BACT|nr:ester cyclase [Neolewinella xylanilytica]PPK84754.1 SnoaL-like polyketide cyclase [Neolewinella xylanilytica]